MKQILSLGLGAVLMLAGATSLRAETLEANIPFGFSVGTSKMAAGVYRLDSRQGLVLVRSSETGKSAFKLVPSAQTGNSLVFDCKQGTDCSFSEIRDSKSIGAKQVAGQRVVMGILMASN